MFVRIKLIKGNPYAYLVENIYKEKSSRQKVSKYLGRVFTLNSLPYNSLPLLEGLSYPQSIRAICIWQAQRLGFTKQDSHWVSDHLVFDTLELRIYNKTGNRDAVIKNHEGYFCTHTLHNLLDFLPQGTEQDTGYALARSCVEAGLELPKELFIALFEKIMPEITR